MKYDVNFGKVEDNNRESYNESFAIQVVKIDDILNDLHLTEEEKLIYKDLILDYEKFAAENIKKHNTVLLSHIGSISKRVGLEAIGKRRKELHEYRKTCTKEEYKDYVRSIMFEATKKFDEEKSKERIIKNTKIRNNTKYNKYLKNMGKAYADLFILSVSKFNVIEFDQEYEEAYQNLIKNNRDV